MTVAVSFLLLFSSRMASAGTAAEPVKIPQPPTSTTVTAIAATAKCKARPASSNLPATRASVVATDAWLAAAASAEGKQKGRYISFPLKQREQALIEDAHELEVQFNRRSLVYRDPALEQWLACVAVRVLPASTDPYIQYRLSVLRDPSPNAFALPDGQIYIHTGMLARLQNESQLAAVLAHEAVHVAGHHGIVSYRSARENKIASVTMGSIAGVLGPLGAALGAVVPGLANAATVTSVASMATDVGIAQSVFGYQRDLEREADRRAAYLLQQGGFDADELPSLLRILSDDPEALHPRLPAVWSAHPELIQRFADSREVMAHVPKTNGGTTNEDEKEFHQHLAPFMLITIEDYVQLGYPRIAISLAKGLLQRQPHNPQVLVALGDAWQAMGARPERLPDQPLTDKQRQGEGELLQSEEIWTNLRQNMERARQAYLAAVEIDPSAVEAHRELGDVYYKLGMYEEAARSYLKYVKARPAAPDKAAVLHRLEAIAVKLKAAGRGAQ